MRKLLFCLSIISLTSCDQYVEKKSAITQAVAIIKPAPGSTVNGKVTFTAIGEGVRVVADLDGLTPGSHGFHIHEFGRCEGDFTSAGSHFNPTNAPHAGPNSPLRHEGDLGNIVADQNGKAHYDRVDTVLKLEGNNSVIGKSIIVHINEDDFMTQPTGNAGGRIGCGIIEEISPPTVPKDR